MFIAGDRGLLICSQGGAAASSLMRWSSEPSAVSIAPACWKYFSLAEPLSARCMPWENQFASRIRRSEAVRPGC